MRRYFKNNNIIYLLYNTIQYLQYNECSLFRLHELPELVTNWSGPLSIAVFGPAAELGIAVHYIRYLRSCNAAVRAQAAFHLVYPGQHPGTLHSAQLAEMVGRPDCSQPKQVLQVR